MYKISLSFLTVVSVYMFLVSPYILAQDYVLLNEGFEAEKNTNWLFKNSQQVESQSYRGNKSVEVNGNGVAERFIDIPQGVNEIIVKGRIKLKISNSTKNK